MRERGNVWLNGLPLRPKLQAEQREDDANATVSAEAASVRCRACAGVCAGHVRCRMRRPRADRDLTVRYYRMR